MISEIAVLKNKTRMFLMSFCFF